MYATPIVYPTSLLPERWHWLMALNPMAPLIELFRYALLGVGIVSVGSLLMSLFATAMILVVGVVLFSRVEKNFMDTV